MPEENLKILVVDDERFNINLLVDFENLIWLDRWVVSDIG
jgi:hypothetical protein